MILHTNIYHKLITVFLTLLELPGSLGCLSHLRKEYPGCLNYFQALHYVSNIFFSTGYTPFIVIVFKVLLDMYIYIDYSQTWLSIKRIRKFVKQTLCFLFYCYCVTHTHTGFSFIYIHTYIFLFSTSFSLTCATYVAQNRHNHKDACLSVVGWLRVLFSFIKR